MTITQAIRTLELKRKQLERGIAKAESQTIQEAKGKAIMASSGHLSTAEQRKIARSRGAGVYSRRNPDPRYDPSIINAQTGEFRSHWFTDEYDGNGSMTHSLINAGRTADFMKGTRLMIARGIIERVAKSIEKSRMRRLKSAIDKVMQT